MTVALVRMEHCWVMEFQVYAVAWGSAQVSSWQERAVGTPSAFSRNVPWRSSFNMVRKIMGSQPGAAVEEGEGVLVGVGMQAGHTGGAA